MSTPTNHWKLGLFVVVGFIAIIATVLLLGARGLQKENVRYVSYFDESVQGLEVGSPVKFRGVTIGSVAEIAVADDHRHVEVSSDLAVKVLNSLRLSVPKSPGVKTKMDISPNLRVQLGSAGITGVKFILLDFFDPKDYPPIALPFATPENYLPAAPSVMKNLEDSVVHAVDRFPALADQLVVMLSRVANLLGNVEGQNLPERVAATLSRLDRVLDDLHAAETPRLSRDAHETLKSLNEAIISLNQVLQRMAGEKGLVASAQHTSDALGNMAQNANHVGPALEETMRDVQTAAQSIQRLADSLDLDPDMLIKGRAKKGNK